MKRPKILHVIVGLNVGGAEKTLSRLVRHMDKTRYENVVCCLLPPGDVAREIEEAGIRVTSCGWSRKVSIAPFFRLIHTVRRERPDILQTWMYHSNVLGRILGRIMRVPFIVSGVQDTEPNRNRVRVWIEGLTACLATAVVAASPSVKAIQVSHEGVPIGKVVVVPNGVETDLFVREVQHQANTVIWIGVVGRLHPKKGHIYLLRAFPAILRSIPNCRLLLAGDGPERENLISECKALGILDRVEFLGIRNDIASLLGRLDVFVFPTLWEGLPCALVEAALAGVPIVTTTAPGVIDVVDDRTAILVPPADSDALATAVVRMVLDKELAGACAAAARERARRRFSVEAMVRGYDQLYSSLIGSARAA